MALAIATNNAAMRAAVAASSVNRDIETSMARLSSGKRINSASDDAAGVAIASRLIAEIRGTNQAVRNALDGQALLDTAEGAHKEIENILQRMREVSVQAANDTNNAQDRANLQAEFDAMTSEINRIAGTTTWAGTKMLDAGGSDFSFQIGSGVSDQDHVEVSIGAMTSSALGFQTINTTTTSTTAHVPTSTTPVARDDEFLVNMFTTSESQTNPKITKLTDGSFVVVWQSNVTGGKTWAGRNIDYEIRGQKFDASGVPVGSEIQIGTDAVRGKTDDRATIAALAGGKFAVTWNKWTDNGNNVLLRTYDSNAQAEQTAPITVSPSTRYQYSSIVSLKDGSYIIAYDSARKDSGNFYNYYRKISPDGTMSEQSRLSSGITFGGGGNGGNSNVELTALDNGGFFATWAVYADWNALEGFSPGNGQVNYGVHGRIFDSSGNPVGGDFLINAPDPSTHQNGPDTTTLSNGDIVVTWQDSSLEGDGYGIYQQRYTSVGVAKETAPVLVNTVTADNQMDPSVNALTDGGYIISWSGFQSGDYDVYGQRFSSSGQKIGDEFQLNQETSNSQRYSELSSLDDGSFVATWTSTEQDLDGHGIYARIFDTANAETTSTTTEVIIQNVGLNSTATALSSIAVVDAAIQKVNHQRSQLGAASNRLNHTVNNLTNISANLSAARGGIEDADFALETTNLAKNQILQQASTAMLAQANASKQNVLSLLQG